MSLRQPFQKLCFVHKNGDSGTGSAHFIAAAGAYIYTLDLYRGQVMSRWPGTMSKKPKVSRSEEGKPPEKRRRLSNSAKEGQSESEGSSSSVEIKTEKVKGQRRRPKPEPSLPNVSHLVAVPQRSKLIAVTAEDKCIRVFSVDDYGALSQLSERVMPKRPSAIILSPSEMDIIVGDKFGDVYSLPLEHSAGPPPEIAKPIGYTGPSASEFTVHTKRNLAALKQQRLRQETSSASPAKKEEKFNFSSKLLLGHVSLLTALDFTIVHTATDSENVPPQDSRSRSYLLTSDRDEHIRISRLPQPHIIESYCHGHTSFVTSLCIPQWATNIVISGSGVPDLRTHEIPSGRSLSQLLLKRDITEGRCDTSVSGIWSSSDTAPLSGVRSKGLLPEGIIFVALEGCPSLYPVAVNPKTGELSCHTPIDFPSNVLDVAFIPTSGGDGEPFSVIVSLDTAHEPGSTKIACNEKVRQAPFLDFLRVNIWASSSATTGLSEGHVVNERQVLHERLPILDKLNETLTKVATSTVSVEPSNGKDGKSVYTTLGEFLYGRENLRKKSLKDMKKEENEEDGTAAVEAVEDGVAPPRSE